MCAGVWVNPNSFWSLFLQLVSQHQSPYEIPLVLISIYYRQKSEILHHLENEQASGMSKNSPNSLDSDFSIDIFRRVFFNLGFHIPKAEKLGSLDSNQDQRLQRPLCCQLHHSPMSAKALYHRMILLTMERGFPSLNRSQDPLFSPPGMKPSF